MLQVSFKSDWRRHFVDNKEAKRGRRDKKNNMQTLCLHVLQPSVFRRCLTNANCSFSRSLFVFNIAINIVLRTSYRGIREILISFHPWYAGVRPHTAAAPRGLRVVWRGMSGGQRGDARGEAWQASRVAGKPEKSLNPAEFLSSSAAPLGGVRSLWRERGKTGTVRNKAPNSHDMFS